MKTLAALLLAALPLLAAAQSQTVWRCGPEGRSYSSTPCAEGRALELADTARPAEDLAAAKDMAARERRLAEQMRHDRLQAEARAAHQGAAGIGAAKRAAPISTARAAAPHKPKLHRHGPGPRPEDGGTWRAAAPASPRTPG